jgi:hypothetical protein
MKLFRHISIRAQLITIILGVSVITTVVGFTVVMTNEISRERSAMIREASLMAELVGEYCVTPLTFDDSGGASEVLSRLAGMPSVQRAYVYDGEGKLFASYGVVGEQARTGSLYLDKGVKSEFQGQYLHISQPKV